METPRYKSLLNYVRSGVDLQVNIPKLEEAVRNSEGDQEDAHLAVIQGIIQEKEAYLNKQAESALWDIRTGEYAPEKHLPILLSAISKGYITSKEIRKAISKGVENAEFRKRITAEL